MPQITQSKKRGKDGTSQFTITFTAEESTAAQEHALQHAAEQLTVPGFRPGKAPMDMVRSKVNPNDLLEDAVHELVRAQLPSMVTENKLEPIIAPSIALEKKEPLTVTMTFVEKPAVTLGKLSAITPEKKTPKVEDKHFDQVLNSIASQHAVTSVVERPSKMGDKLTIDFKGSLLDGTEPSGLKAAGYAVTLGSQNLVPGMEEELTGIAPGGSKTFTVTFPKEHEQLGGKPVTFAVNVSRVEEVSVPELTDDFVKEKLGRPSAQALKDDVRNSLMQQEENFEQRRRRDEMLSKLVKAVSVELAPGLVAEEMRSIAGEISQQLQERGTTMQEWIKTTGKKPEEIEAEWKKQAEERLKLRMGIQELMAQQEITVTDEEVSAEVAKQAQRVKSDADRAEIEKQYAPGANARAQLEWQMKVEKLFEKICN